MNDDLLEQPWQSFMRKEGLSIDQAHSFMRYAQMLQEWNKKINLTAIDDIPSIMTDHFQDSLKVANFIDFNQLQGIADVGSGAGFPGIPLAICYPNLPLYVIEVNNKKIAFLEEVIKQLGLTQVTICPWDWRTFLRTTTYTIDLFCARASLSVPELLRMFKPHCHYRSSVLIYWASKHWQIGTQEQPFLKKEEFYTVGNKKRRLIFFSAT